MKHSIKIPLLCILLVISLLCLNGCKHEETPTERSERLQRELEEAQRKNREAQEAYNSLYNDISYIDNYQKNH